MQEITFPRSYISKFSLDFPLLFYFVNGFSYVSKDEKYQTHILPMKYDPKSAYIGYPASLTLLLRHATRGTSLPDSMSSLILNFAHVS